MRLFVAVPLPDELKEMIGRLGREITQDGIKLVEPDKMHITLKFLGEIPEEKVSGIKENLKSVKFRKFACNAKGTGVFPNEDYIRVVWVGCESQGGMEGLAEKVHGALKGKKERFSSHITIARVKRKVDLKEFLAKHREDGFGDFEVSEFLLMKSELKGEGPEYSTIARFAAEDKYA